MKFKALFCKNPKNEKDHGKYYPFPVYEETIGTDEFVTDISHSTSLTGTDVKAVISEILVVFRRYLARGHKVRLDGIGTFKVSFRGDGAPTADALSASDIDMYTVRVSFVGDNSLKQEMRGGISFYKVAKKSVAPKAEKREKKKAEEKPADGSGTQEN